jgi:ferredoxin--NADP+ reductase
VTLTTESGPTLRIAVVGAGPGGIYATGALCSQDAVPVEVDVLERIPTPFGLLRYGVAPDHLKIKSLERALQKVIDDPRVRLFADVTVGRTLTVDELRSCYDAVVYAVGAPDDRRLGVPGEDLRGSTSATSFVAWYSGHPDYWQESFRLDSTAAAVVGLGNVAVDVARILLKPVDELRGTDMPQSVLAALAASSVTDVHVLGRRGPAFARWTHKELRELGDLHGVDVVVDPADLELDEESSAVLAADHRQARMVDTLVEWSQRPRTDAPRRLHLHFRARPTEIVAGEGAAAGDVRAIRFEHVTGVASDAPVVFPRELEVGMVLRSVGYAGVELPGLPFDGATGTVPTDAGGRVLRDGDPSTGEYVSGWARRGPSGVIGTNRPDGELVARSVAQDADVLAARAAAGPGRDRDALARLLRERGATHVDLQGWAAIDGAEIAAGAAEGRARAKLATWEALRDAASRPPSTSG